jgi:DNA-binding CsgD family transcriptional regulator
LQAAARALISKRGRATELREMFETSRIPMVLLESRGRYVDANPPSRLFLRRTRAQLLADTTHDFIPRARRSHWDELWNVLLTKGTVRGSSTIRTPDGATVAIDYCAVANLLPGKHLFIWLPSEWHAVELGELFEPPVPAERRRLTNREREVLSVLASGASLREISEQLSLSPHTVKTHLRNAVRRLGARHRAHAIALALRDGEI